jgi:hypothetical protein
MIGDLFPVQQCISMHYRYDRTCIQLKEESTRTQPSLSNCFLRHAHFFILFESNLLRTSTVVFNIAYLLRSRYMFRDLVRVITALGHHIGTLFLAAE